MTEEISAIAILISLGISFIFPILEYSNNRSFLLSLVAWILSLMVLVIIWAFVVIVTESITTIL